MESLERFLREHDFFRGMQEPHLDLLAGCARNVTYAPGEVLFSEGEPANSFFVIRQGRVALDLSAPGIETMTLQTCGEGEIVGWSWLIAPNRWRYTGRATLPTRTLEMDARCIRRKCDESTDLGYALLQRFSRVLARRLDAAQLQLLDVFATKGGAPR